jgi:hypothetical protein
MLLGSTNDYYDSINETQQNVVNITTTGRSVAMDKEYS